MAETRRQEIERLLRQGPTRLEDLARRSGATVSSVAKDLEHVARSLRGRGKLLMRPAECLSCGFAFRQRRRFTTPSRCPRCRSENIEEPEFWIEG